MKYKQYILTFKGDQEVIAFLEKHIAKKQPNLGQARALGKAARLLLGVDYTVTSITVPRPTAERVLSL